MVLKFVKADIKYFIPEKRTLKSDNLDDINNLFSKDVYQTDFSVKLTQMLELNTCYVPKPLEAQVLENLSALLDHKCKIAEQMIPIFAAETSFSKLLGKLGNNKGINISTDDWHMKPSGSFTTGVQWLYHFTAQELYKDGENQRTSHQQISILVTKKIALWLEFKFEKNRNIIVESIESNNPCFKRKLEKSETEQKLYIKLLKYF
ncbi:hypothetical protein Glove_86g129 [Diversispora epigaea]|uniref:Uncharacterized protein n=1 Tax=Diversispora epigaea TaxID=1348612 RepID=A0A397JFS7_9GLOM|nr:hypothetical protein Glove_86g129 [Diversispora epigaea]